MNTLLYLCGWISSGLLICSASAVAFTFLGAGLNRLFQRRSAAFRHSIWLATSICIVATPLASIWIPGILPRSTARLQIDEPERLTLAESDRVRSSNPTTENRIAVPDVYDPKDRTLHDRGRDSGKAIGTIAFSSASRTSLIQSAMPVLYAGIAACWFTGLLFYVLCLWRARRELVAAFRQSSSALDNSLASLVAKLANEEGLSVVSTREKHVRRMHWKSVACSVSQSEAGPLIWGFMPAKLLLPASLTTLPVEAQIAVLRHEFAHVDRCDEWVRRYLILLRALFWFHPLVRYCCDQVQLLAEKACDDRVLRLGHRPSLYSALLLDMGRKQCGIEKTFASSGMAQSQIASRINSILQVNASRRPVTMCHAMAITTAMLVMTSAITAIRPANSANESDGPALLAQSNSQSDANPGPKVGKKDWPQWGGSSARNNTPSGSTIPIAWDLKTGMNIRWSMPLGTESYGGTVVANGKVYVGTNNGSAYIKRYPSSIDLGVLLCFDEQEGTFLWQHSNEKLPTGRVHDWPTIGICSAPLVDGNRLWYVTNRGQVVCLDTEGFRDGENDGPFNKEEVSDEYEADVVWVLDMMSSLNVSQHNLANCSVTCAGDLLFVNTSHGVTESHAIEAKNPAPSFLCLSRTTGKVLWTDSSPNGNILHGQWSSPASGMLGGVSQVIFGGGDGYLYGFLADGVDGKSKLLWKFDCNPKDSKYALNAATRNHIIATPVIYQGLVYVAVGEDPEHGEGNGHLWCIDPTKRGDVSPTLVYNTASPKEPIPHKRKQALDETAGDFERPNPNSAAVWHYVGSDPADFKQSMHRTVSTVAIQNELLFVPDFSGLVHCLDAKTGKAHWTHDLLAACWSTALIVDGRVYIGDEDGDVAVFQLSKQKVLLQENNLGSAMYSTPIVANDTLFLANRDRLWAIQEGAKSKPIK